MDDKLFVSERKVMEVLWKEGDITAKAISLILNESIGWNKNTTYTVIKKCIKKDGLKDWSQILYAEQKLQRSRI